MDETERAFYDACLHFKMKTGAIDDALRAFRRWRSSGPPVQRKRTAEDVIEAHTRMCF